MQKYVLATVFSLAIFVFSANQAAASGNITGSFLKKSGSNITVAIDVEPPAPASIILKIKIPGGVGIVSSSPEPKKVKPKQGVIKYLFKKVSPGRHTVQLQLNAPVKARQVRAEIRYRDKESGAMMTVKFD